jgi:hypothetical protein
MSLPPEPPSRLPNRGPAFPRSGSPRWAAFAPGLNISSSATRRPRPLRSNAGLTSLPLPLSTRGVEPLASAGGATSFPLSALDRKPGSIQQLVSFLNSGPICRGLPPLRRTVGSPVSAAILSFNHPAYWPSRDNSPMTPGPPRLSNSWNQGRASSCLSISVARNTTSSSNLPR